MYRLGSGIQSALQARITDRGRLEVAWQAQRVNEGFAATSAATVWYTSARPGGRFARARRVGGSSLTGDGRYVERPGVRLVAIGPDTSLLGWTQYDGARFRVQVADVDAGEVGCPQNVSLADNDVVLGDLASSPAGGALILGLTGTRGAQAVGPRRVAAALRPARASAFGRPEFVSEPVGGAGTPDYNATWVASSPVAAIDERSGRGLAAWTALSGATKVAVRPSG